VQVRDARHVVHLRQRPRSTSSYRASKEEEEEGNTR
jgi:hypothetical protein